jgi:hypothetical protein
MRTQEYYKKVAWMHWSNLKDLFFMIAERGRERELFCFGSSQRNLNMMVDFRFTILQNVENKDINISIRINRYILTIQSVS